jgi:ATP-dependent Lon protease
VALGGKVLPIGGVKQKVLAAHRAGIRTVLLPQANGPDVDDVPEDVRQEMTIHLVGEVSEVLDLALTPEPGTPEPGTPEPGIPDAGTPDRGEPSGVAAA